MGGSWRIASLALFGSLLAHAGLAVLFLARDSDDSIAGGVPTQIAMMGDAFADAIKAGEDIAPTDLLEAEPPADPNASEMPIEPTDTPPAETQPIETTAAETQQTVSPQQTMDQSELVEQTQALLPAAANVDAPSELAASQTNTVVAALSPQPPTEIIEALPEPEAAKPKPNPQKTRKKKTQPKPRQTETRKRGKPVRGNRGQSQQNARKGTNEGRTEQGSTSASSASRQANQAGNASVSSYTGKIRRKIKRRFNARGQRAARRDVVISFVVTKNGQLRSARVASSSGSTKIDQAALRAVNRAAPFPPLPSGKSTLAVSVPMRWDG